MASAGLTPPQRLLSVTGDPAAALRYPSLRAAVESMAVEVEHADGLFGCVWVEVQQRVLAELLLVLVELTRACRSRSWRADGLAGQGLCPAYLGLRRVRGERRRCRVPRRSRHTRCPLAHAEAIG
jgi:hypothetical protein